MTIMDTCDTCKWWGKVRWMRFLRGSQRACEHIATSGEMPDGLKPDQMVSPIHDNYYGSELFTGPKFGCIHWEKK